MEANESGDVTRRALLGAAGALAIAGPARASTRASAGVLRIGQSLPITRAPSHRWWGPS